MAENKMIKGSGKINMQFCLLSVLGMFFVVDGHLNNSYLDIGGLFPYYSFHMPLFVFISGYFYKDGSEKKIGGYFKKKTVRLLVPYLVYNLLYGIAAQLLHKAGFTFGGNLSLRNLLVEPFITGHQFEYNLASWFVPALFLVEVCNVLLRRLLKRFLNNEYLITAIYFAIGLLGINLALGGRNQQGWLTLVRMMFLLPCYQAGILYHRKLEAKDKINPFLYFGFLIGVQCLLALWGRPLIYSVAFCNGFTGLLLPYITAATGIAFWLRISRMGASVMEQCPSLQYFGRNTYGVMMHHVMAVMGLKTVFAATAKYTDLFVGFSFEQYKTDLWYLYFPKGLPQFRVVYLIWAIVVSLMIQEGVEFIKIYGRKCGSKFADIIGVSYRSRRGE